MGRQRCMCRYSRFLCRCMQDMGVLLLLLFLVVVVVVVVFVCLFI